MSIFNSKLLNYQRVRDKPTKKKHQTPVFTGILPPPKKEGTHPQVNSSAHRNQKELANRCLFPHGSNRFWAIPMFLQSQNLRSTNPVDIFSWVVIVLQPAFRGCSMNQSFPKTKACLNSTLSTIWTHGSFTALRVAIMNDHDIPWLIISTMVTTRDPPHLKKTKAGTHRRYTWCWLHPYVLMLQSQGLDKSLINHHVSVFCLGWITTFVGEGRFSSISSINCEHVNLKVYMFLLLFPHLSKCWTSHVLQSIHPPPLDFVQVAATLICCTRAWAVGKKMWENHGGKAVWKHGPI